MHSTATFLYSELIKLVLSQASLKKGKTVMPHIIEGPVQGHITEDRKKKNLSTGGSRTHALSVMRGALYLCATTAANYFTVL